MKKRIILKESKRRLIEADAPADTTAEVAKSTDDLLADAREWINSLPNSDAWLDAAIDELNESDGKKVIYKDLIAARERIIDAMGRSEPAETFLSLVPQYTEAFKKALPEYAKNDKITSLLQQLDDRLNDAVISGTESTDGKRVVADVKNYITSLDGAIEAAINDKLTKDDIPEGIRHALAELDESKSAALNALRDTERSDPDKGNALKALLDWKDDNPQPTVDILSDGESNAFLTYVNGCAEKLNELTEKLAPGESGLDKAGEKAKALMAKRDWATELKEVAMSKKLTNKLWAEYYETEWGSDAKKVEALGGPFREELFSLGFDGNSNPFIPFLKRNLGRLNLTYGTYGAVHNAFILRYIDSAALRGVQQGANYGELTPAINILNCADLYSNTPATIVEFFKWQYMATKQFAVGAAKTSMLDSLRPIYIGQDAKNANDFVSVLLAANGDFFDKRLNAPKQSLENAKLKSIDQAKAMFAAAFPDVKDDEKIKAEGDDIFHSAPINGDKKTAIRALAYIAFVLSTKSVNLFDKLKGKDSSINWADYINPDTAGSMSSILDIYDINRQNVGKVIDDIAKAAGIGATGA